MRLAPLLHRFVLLLAVGAGPVGCGGDSVGPSAGWPGGITGRLAFLGQRIVPGYGGTASESLYVASSPDAPPHAWARFPDSILSPRGGPAETFTGPYLKALSLVWNRRADTVAVSLIFPYGVSNGTAIWYVDFHPGRQPQLPVMSDLFEKYATWAPDGRFAYCRISFPYGFEIVLGGTPVLEVDDSGCGGPFDVFPDGKTLVTSRVLQQREANSVYDIYTLGLFVVPLIDTASARRIASDTVTGYRCYENCEPVEALEARVSPHGDEIAFVRGSELDGDTRIWLAGADGTNPHPITEGPEDFGPPVWSTDGNWVIFRRGTKEIAAVRRDGTESLSLFTWARGIGAFDWSRR